MEVETKLMIITKYYY